MNYNTAWMPQARAFFKALSPEPRQALKQAIQRLASGRSAGLDLRALEGPLTGYMRLRVQTYRAIYEVKADAKGPTIVFLAIGPRSTVYEAFEKMLADQSLG